MRDSIWLSTALLMSGYAFGLSATLSDSKLSLPDVIAGEPSEWSISGSTKFDSSKAILADSAEAWGTLWSKHKNPYESWTAEFKYHVSGRPNYPGKDVTVVKDGLAFWYTANPNTEGHVKGSTDYWDGLAFLIDYDGWDNKGAGPDKGGIKGHLNDGTVGYTSMVHGGENAFAFCGINYRNSVEDVLVTVGYSPKVGLVVLVNGQKCFRTEKVTLPTNTYYFGFSAFSSGDIYTVSGFKVYEGMQPVIEKLTTSNTPVLASEDQHQKQKKSEELKVSNTVDLSDFNRMKDELVASINQLKSLKTEDGSSKVVQFDTEPIKAQLTSLESRLNGLEGIMRSIASDQQQLKREMLSRIDTVQEHVDSAISRVNDHTTTLHSSSSTDIPQPTSFGSHMSLILQFVFIQVVIGLVMNWNRRRNRHEKLI